MHVLANIENYISASDCYSNVNRGKITSDLLKIFFSALTAIDFKEHRVCFFSKGLDMFFYHPNLTSLCYFFSQKYTVFGMKCQFTLSLKPLLHYLYTQPQPNSKPNYCTFGLIYLTCIIVRICSKDPLCSPGV